MSRLLAILAVVPCATAAWSQEPPPEAREFYERGQTLYEEGRYREAIVELERAYTLDPGGTILLYNIGLIYEKLGEVDRALQYYERYLQHELAPDERERVEGIQRRLQGARPQVEQPDPDPGRRDPLPPPPPPRTPVYGRADALFWIAGGVAVAALAVGGVFGALALGNDADAEAIVAADEDDLALRQELADTADGQALVADIALGGALVLGATSALLYFLREKDGMESAGAVSAALLPGGGAVVLRVETP